MLPLLVNLVTEVEKGEAVHEGKRGLDRSAREGIRVLLFERGFWWKERRRGDLKEENLRMLRNELEIMVSGFRTSVFGVLGFASLWRDLLILQGFRSKVAHVWHIFPVEMLGQNIIMGLAMQARGLGSGTFFLFLLFKVPYSDGLGKLIWTQWLKGSLKIKNDVRALILDPLI